MVDGAYPLLSPLSDAAGDALFETETPDRVPALIRLHPGDAPDADALLRHWTAVAGLSHPHLIRFLAVGQTTLDSTPVCYAVMERAEETLADVLASRPLTESETREMLEPTLRALGYLHGQGFVHDSLEPGHVFAVEDTLKLSSDTIAPSGDPTDDVRRLGSLIALALAQREPVWGSGEIVSPALPSPFAQIVARCCDPDPDRRWSVAQITAALEGRPVDEKPVLRVAEPEPPPVLQPELPFEPEPIPPMLDAPQLSPSPAEPEPYRVPRTLAGTPQRQTLETYEAKPERPRWLVPAGIGAVAVLLLVLWAAGHSSKPAPTAPAPAPVAGSAAQTNPPSAAAVPASPRPVPLPVQKASSSPSPHVRKTSSWYVVVATYSQRDQAEKRAHAITHRWPRFAAHVYNPPVEHPHHLVVIGANLSEEGAEALRKRARAAGLPRDLYIKHFPG